MEYSRSFALIEAIALVALTAWLFYINASSGRRDAEAEDTGAPEKRGDADDQGAS